jgi:hypothetical protein
MLVTAQWRYSFLPARSPSWSTRHATNTATPGAQTIRDQVEEDALRLRREEVLADEFDARAHAAQVEVDIKTVRACSLQQQATVHRSEAVTSRDQLNEMRDSVDKLAAAARPTGLPRLAG